MNSNKTSSELVVKNEEQKIDYSGYEDAFYMYETPETGLFESRTMIDGLEFASIESLKKELFQQYGIIVFEEDSDYDESEIETGEKLNDLIVRGTLHDVLICKEGAFFWNEFHREDEGYEYCGTFNKQNTYRVKRVEIPHDRAILIEGEITVIKKGHYDILHEEVISINSDVSIEMFTIRLLTGKQVTIPNNPGFYSVYEVEYALIDYIDKYK